MLTARAEEVDKVKRSEVVKNEKLIQSYINEELSGFQIEKMKINYILKYILSF